MQQILGKYDSIVGCRSCGSTQLTRVLDLGQMALANALVTPEQTIEKTYPLELVFCRGCSLTQLNISIDPTEIFDTYLYFSSYSDTMLEHVRKTVRRLIQEYELNDDDLVVEIASNDGYLLQYVNEYGIPSLGIEPAQNVAAVAQEKGIDTIVEYFGNDLAKRLVKEGRRASIVFANNVLAHVPEIHSFVEGIRTLLRHDGVAVIETPYIKPLLDDCKFDTIYHEHLFYYSLTALKHLVEQHGLEIVKVEHLHIHGGSLRVFLQHMGTTDVSQSVTHLLNEEDTWVFEEDYYTRFAKNVKQIQRTLRDVVLGLKTQDRKIAAYGAAAKGTVFANALGLDASIIDFVVDRSPHKQGHLMPGVHIPVYGVEHLLEQQPDYLLIFIWNFAKEVMEQQSEFKQRGGQFIISLPHIQISVIDDLSTISRV